MSEAQGYLKSSRQELGELRHLAWKLEQMGRNRHEPWRCDDATLETYEKEPRGFGRKSWFRAPMSGTRSQQILP